MRLPSAVRAALIALALFAGSSAGPGRRGAVTLVIFKAGWFVGGSAGQGVLTFHGRPYALTAGGLDDGLVFGGSQTTLAGPGQEHPPGVRILPASMPRRAPACASAPACAASC